MKLFSLLPTLTLGKAGRGEVRAVRRIDMDALFSLAMREGLDIWNIARDGTPEGMQALIAKEQNKPAE